MLTKLSLGGFKSIATDTDLEIAPLTLLCGANSSGKSSILQALLLLSQTIAGRRGEPSLQFNGILTELGTFDEVVHEGGRRIHLGCEVRIDSGQQGGRSLTARLLGLDQDADLVADLSLEVEAPGKPEGSTSRLAEASITANVGGAAARLTARKRRGGRPPGTHLPAGIAPATVLSNHDYAITVTETLPPDPDGDSLGLVSLEEEHSPLGVQFLGVVPESLWASYSPLERQLERLVRAPQRQSPGSPSLDPAVMEALSEFWRVAPASLELGPFPGSAADVVARLRPARFPKRSDIRRQLLKFARDRASRPNAPVAYERTSLPPVLELASEAIASDLREVRHLGPLREPPRPFHSLPTSGDQRSVGHSGEYTAAVLTRLNGEDVKYDWNGEEVTTPLGVAVNRWMAYLGVHSEAHALELGKFGHFVGVTDDSLKRYLDLTQVGVGVSQVLPVIVQALVAPAGSTLLLEQPELHLHPAVQSRLATFLTAVTSTRTIVCETHSEYLITQLRLRVAARPELYGPSLRCYFTERFQGRTTVEEVPFGPRAELGRWPAGFFDQSAHDARSILEAQLQ